MLNEAPRKKPKKIVDYAHPTAWQLFRRTQWECFRRSVTPYLMYLFMSLLCLVTQLAPNTIVKIALGIACIIAGAFYNSHLCYNYGKLHYGSFVAGELHRKNEMFGVQSGGDHRPEREFRVWKGFLIGFYVSIPVIFFGVLVGATRSSIVQIFMMMFAGWALIPITWFGTAAEGGLVASPYWSLLFVLVPVIVSGASYLIGAHSEKKARMEEAQRSEAVLEAGKKASERKGKK